MSFVSKTDWKPSDPVTENDLNRWESGIEYVTGEVEKKANQTDIALLKDAQSDLKCIRASKDVNAIFTSITYRRKSDNTVYATSVLSGGTSPNYTTRTVTYYEPNGTAVKKIVTYTLSYDTDGALVSEV